METSNTAQRELGSRSKTPKVQVDAKDADAFQGCVFWLPCEEELPSRAVRRAHGKGIVEGIYGHPVVVVSRPAEESHIVHFQLISSLQGKTLAQLYNKSNEFHVSRRRWYLPVAPAPNHPDATSKMTRKRFPTLELADGATLRWKSYVNIRHVYKVNWSLLKVYTNPEMPTGHRYRFERESTIKLLAKSKILTKYESGLQYQSPLLKIQVMSPKEAGLQRPVQALERSKSEQESKRTSKHATREGELRRSSVPGAASTTSLVDPGILSPQSVFRMPINENYEIDDPPRKIPPDIEVKMAATSSVQWLVWRPADRLLQRVGAGFARNQIGQSFQTVAIRRPIHQFWVDVKGVTAVTIASVY
ncbi:hypothetical protein BDW02DRAFT_487135 [Decorospora gaudefroyi]|uniref:Uncharacterized protein n=1 Tax=Decorospora gaudefroyi TaxID=184978 RepID=A0A6A5KVX0_9PLEO|nr:hypothetical protein BDW02DRAFT_487135 [Decorospora gaudefroyi]